MELPLLTQEVTQQRERERKLETPRWPTKAAAVQMGPFGSIPLRVDTADPCDKRPREANQLSFPTVLRRFPPTGASVVGYSRSPFSSAAEGRRHKRKAVISQHLLTIWLPEDREIKPSFFFFAFSLASLLSHLLPLSRTGFAVNAAPSSQFALNLSFYSSKCKPRAKSTAQRERPESQECFLAKTKRDFDSPDSDLSASQGAPCYSITNSRSGCYSLV